MIKIIIEQFINKAIRDFMTFRKHFTLPFSLLFNARVCRHRKRNFLSHRVAAKDACISGYAVFGNNALGVITIIPCV